MRYYAENFEDEWIWNHLPIPERGVFVDVGSGHPVIRNNTMAFEASGWKGFLIEPDPRREAASNSRRSAKLIACAAGSCDIASSLGLAEDPDESSVAQSDQPRHPVPIRRLVEICRELAIGRIDLLSIDTNGTELDVWDGLGLCMVNAAPTPAAVIFSYAMTHPIPIIDRLLASDYALVGKTATNLIFWNVTKG
jgi:FkbM family methyltransferase